MLRKRAICVLAFVGIGVPLGLVTIAATPPTGLNRTTIAGNRFQTVHMYSFRQGLGITWKGAIEQTTDGGAQWTNVTPTGYHATGVASFVLLHGNPVAWVVANRSKGPSTLLVTPNDGYSFHTRPIPKGIEASEVQGMVFIKVNRILLIAVVKHKPKVFTTVNDGFRWNLARIG